MYIFEVWFCLIFLLVICLKERRVNLLSFWMGGMIRILEKRIRIFLVFVKLVKLLELNLFIGDR